MKLPLQEAEQEALLAELVRWDGYVSSSLLGVEAIRACERYGEGYAADARSFLMDVSLLPLEDAILTDEIGVFITYDQGLRQAAAGKGLVVTQPS